MLNFRRSLPYLIHQQGWQQKYHPHHRRLKLVCLKTGSGRSITRLTRHNRLMFRQLLNQGLYGCRRSTW